MSNAFKDLLQGAREDLHLPASAGNPDRFVRQVQQQRTQARRLWWLVRAPLVPSGSLLVMLFFLMASFQRIRDTDFAVAALLAVPPAAILVAGVVLSVRRHAGAQLLGRACLWSVTLLANITLIAVDQFGGTDPDFETYLVQGMLALVVVSCVAALLGLNRWTVAVDDPTVFRPAAFRSLLVLSLVMGMADGLVLTVFGLAAWDPANLICAALIFGAGIGLYRLRAWGLLAMAVANLAEMLLAFNSVLQLPDAGVYMLGATSLVQMILPVPIYAAVIRGKVLRDPGPMLARLPDAVLVLLALAAVVSLLP